MYIHIGCVASTIGFINGFCRLFASTDTSGDQKVDYEEFVQILKTMDRNLKSLPATAQVASQQVKDHLMCTQSLTPHLYIP